MTDKITMRLSDLVLAIKGKCCFLPTDTIHNRARCVKIKNTHNCRIKVADAVLNHFELYKVLDVKFRKQLDEVREILIDGMSERDRKYLHFTILQAGLFLYLDHTLPFEYDKDTTIDTITDEEEIERFSQVLEKLLDSVGEVAKSLNKLNNKIDNEGDDEI